MINIVCNDLGIKTIVMKNLGTIKRAEEFLRIFKNNNSLNNKKYKIVEIW